MRSFGQHAPLLAGLLLSRRAPSALAECGETDAHLRVSYSVDALNLLDLDLGLDDEFKRLSIRPSSSMGDAPLYEATVDYYSVEELVDFERCFPRKGACLDVAVSRLPREGYEIYWDGRAVDVGPEYVGEFWSFTSTEVGDYCSPVCGDGEALFEYRYQSSIGFEDYRVEDADGNYLLGCDSSNEECQMDHGEHADAVHTNRACLERDACHRLLIGDNIQRIPGYEKHGNYASVHSILWDGESLDKSPGKLYESIRFGDACASECDPGTESLVEFFMHRISSDDCETHPDFPWELMALDPETKSWSTVAKGAVPSCSDSSLQYESMCLPRDACASFSVSSPAAGGDVVPIYSLAVDGAIYRRKELWIDPEAGPRPEGLTHSTMVGSCAADVCEGPGEALLEVEVKTPSEYAGEDGGPLAAIPGRFEWRLAPTEGTSSKYSLDSEAYFDQISTDLGSVYRTVACVPGDECAYEFGSPSEFVAEYKLRRNNVELSNRGRDDADSRDVTLFGEGCGSTEAENKNAATLIGYTSIVIIMAALGTMLWL